MIKDILNICAWFCFGWYIGGAICNILDYIADLLLGWLESKKQENSPVLKRHPVDRWIPLYGHPDLNAWQCTGCGKVQYLKSGTPLENGWNYCPHCGVRIYEEKTNEQRGND